MPYLLDSNIFISAKNAHYRFKICPGFWDWVRRAHGAGDVFSIQAVYRELTRGNDDLATWIQACPTSLFLQEDPAVVSALQVVSRWAIAGQYTQDAINTFFAAADYRLVAHAQAKGFTVVTHEQPRPNSTRRITIPDACIGVGVIWTNPFRMLEDLGARFVLPA